MWRDEPLPWWVHPTCELMLISCGWEVSLPDVGLSELMHVASASLAHSQSGQYLLREMFVPPQTTWWVHLTCELMLISCGWEASLPDVGLSKSVWVASASSAHSQSGQYLLRERFVPPHMATHHIYMISVDALYRFQGLNTNYNHKTS